MERDIDLAEKAASRALGDLRRVSRRWLFRIPVVVLTVAFAVWGTLLPPDASAAGRVALAAGGTVGGVVVVGVVAFLFFLVLAPFRQRNDARLLLRRLRGEHPDDPTALVREFSSWVDAARAALPDRPSMPFSMRLMFDREASAKAEAEHAAATLRYSATRAEVERQARVAWHERFREPVVDRLRLEHDGTLNEPHDIDDFEELERRLLLQLSSQADVVLPSEILRKVLRRDASSALAYLDREHSAITGAADRAGEWDYKAAPRESCGDLEDEFEALGQPRLHTVVAAAYRSIDSLSSRTAPGTERVERALEAIETARAELRELTHG